MKTKEEIEQLAEKNFPIEEYPTCEGFEHFAYKQGYTQCQNDMAKKYTGEDIKKAYNKGYRDAESLSIEFPYKEGNVDNRDISEFKNAEHYIQSLNKQD
jgi:hypothetical protein